MSWWRQSLLAIERVRHDVHSLRSLIVSEFSDLRDSLVGTFEDLAAKIDRLQASVDAEGTDTRLSVEDQATFDEIKAAVAAARASVGDENADGTPAPVEPPPVV